MTNEPFNKFAILELLTSATQGELNGLEILPQVDSTNQYLLDKAKFNTRSGYVCLAEEQTAGRGRQGKSWISASGKNIACSVLWHFAVPITQLSGLSLAVGIAVIRTLKNYGITEGLGAKWPNDIYWNYKKLAGILIEIAAHKANSCKFVIGIGINLDLSSKQQAFIDQPWTDIKTIAKQTIKRNQLAALLINELFLVLTDFADRGFAFYRQEWLKYDITFGKQVSLAALAQPIFHGIMQDINDQGELVVKDEQGIVKTYVSGEVSLRLSL